MRKKALSPIIATVLLIAMVIVLAAIVFIWLRSLSTESVTKFEENIQYACDKTSLSVEYADGSLTLINQGDVPVYQMKIIKYQANEYAEEDLTLPSTGLNPGKIYSPELGDMDGVEKIALKPVLIGKGEDGSDKTFVCETKTEWEITL